MRLKDIQGHTEELLMTYFRFASGLYSAAFLCMHDSNSNINKFSYDRERKYYRAQWYIRKGEQKKFIESVAASLHIYAQADLLIIRLWEFPL